MKKTLLGAAFLLATLLTFGINNASAEGHNVNFADGTDYKIVVNAPNPITSGTPVEKDIECSIIITVTNDKKEVDKVTATGGVTLTQGADKNNWSFKMGEQIVDITVTLKDKASTSTDKTITFANGEGYTIAVKAASPITSGATVKKDTKCSIEITVTDEKKEVDNVTATGVTLTQGADKNHWSFTMGEQDVTITVTLKDKATVAVEDAVLEAVAVYPNPFTNELYVAHTADVAKVSLLNAQGIVVRTQLPNGAEQIRLAVEDLPAGLYMVVVEKDQAKKLFRVVK